MDVWTNIRSAVMRNGGRCGNGVGLDDISRAEHSLRVTFPAELRHYLNRIGWMDVGGNIFYGLGPDLPMPSGMDLREMTRSEREDVEPPMQQHLIPILNNGGGDHWCVDTRSGDVVRWNHELDDEQTPEFVDASLSGWMLKRLREDLVDDEG